jgi:DNA polymerase elongation subunit (family B)
LEYCIETFDSEEEGFENFIETIEAFDDDAIFGIYRATFDGSYEAYSPLIKQKEKLFLTLTSPNVSFGSFLAAE